MTEPVQVKIVAVETISKGLYAQPSDFGGTFFSFDYSIEVRVNADQKLVFVLLKTFIRDMDKSTRLAHFVIACIFNVANFESYIKLNENGLYNVPDDLDFQFKAITTATARGVIYAELRGTYLHTAIMPLVDIRNLKPQEQMNRAE